VVQEVYVRAFEYIYPSFSGSRRLQLGSPVSLSMRLKVACVDNGRRLIWPCSTPRETACPRQFHFR
jgi:hypothetical protein